VLLLNNDTEVDPGLLRAFADAAARFPQVGLFAAKIYFFDEPRKLFYRGAKFIWQLAGFIHTDHHEIDVADSNEIEDTGFASGCTLLASGAMIRRIGMLDPRFFLNWEDIEWSTRAIDAGFGCKLVQAARVWHKVSASFVGGGEGAHHRYYFARNQLLWIRSHLGRRYVFSLLVRVIGWRIARDVLTVLNPFAKRDSRRAARAGLCGVRDYFLGRFGKGPAWLSRRPAPAHVAADAAVDKPASVQA
jgi:GT2 family glycosyltransferase